jgi:hypothetical protein
VGRSANPSFLVALGCLAPLVLGAARVDAADEACFESYEKTQRLQKEGKLLEAKEQARICAREICPGALRRDCERWGTEIANSLPTVIFKVRDEHGQDLRAAAVYVDDHKIDGSAEGQPIPLDPGTHVVRFESADRKAEKTFVVTAGEKNQPVDATLPPAAPSPGPAPGLVLAHRRVPTVSLVLSAVAAVGLVSFVSFAVAGRAEQGCAPNCTSGQVTTLRVEYGVADASWITALVAAGGATYFWLSQPRTSEGQPAPSGAPGGVSPEKAGARSAPLERGGDSGILPQRVRDLSVVVAPDRGGAWLGLRGRFE